MNKLIMALATFITIGVGDKVTEVSAEESPEAVTAKHVIMSLDKEVAPSMVADIKTPKKRSEGLMEALAEVEAEMEQERQAELTELRDRQIAITVEKLVAERLAEVERLAQVKAVADAEAVEKAKAVEKVEAVEKAKAVEKAEAVEVQATLATETETTQATVKQETVNVDNSGNELLARLVYAEANGEPYTGLVAVAEVILNRVNSDQFPNSIEGVVYDSGQFSPVGNGMINNHPSQQAVDAVNEALNGTNYTGGALFFYNAQTAESRWLDGKPTITQIGRHTFK